MSVNGVKNAGANIVHAGHNNGNNGGGSGGADFDNQLDRLKRVGLEAAENSARLRELSIALGSLREAGRDKGN